MADVMVTVMPFAGHVAPVAGAVEALVAAGHRVRVYTGSAYLDRFRRLGVDAVPWSAAPEFDEHDVAATFPAAGRPGFRGMLGNVEHVFFRSAVGQVADLLAEYARRPWDVVLADVLSVGGALAAEQTRTLWATLSVLPLSMPSRDLPPPGLRIPPASGPAGRARDAALRAAVGVLSAPLAIAYRQVRGAVGLQPGGRRLVDACYSPHLIAAHGIASLEPPRSDLPPHLHFIGAFPPPAVDGAPDWWPALRDSGERIVHVTQGTFNTDPAELLRPTLEALRDAPELVVVAATGGPDLPFPAPPNARVAGLLPYRELLPRTSVMVTNGGWGGVLAALSNGVPLVVAGSELDKPMIAMLVERAGAGIDLRTGAPTADQVAAGVARVEADPAIRTRAQALAAEFAGHDPGRELVALLERLLAERVPVARAA